MLSEQHHYKYSVYLPKGLRSKILFTIFQFGLEHFPRWFSTFTSTYKYYHTYTKHLIRHPIINDS